MPYVCSLHMPLLCTFQVARETRAMAAAIAEGTGEHQEAEPEEMGDPEGLLYKRANVKRPPPRTKQPAEFAIAAMKIDETQTDRQLIENTARAVKVGSQAAAAGLRGIKEVRESLRIHAQSIVNLQNQVTHLNRILAKFDQPIKPSESATNPVSCI